MPSPYARIRTVDHLSTRLHDSTSNPQRQACQYVIGVTDYHLNSVQALLSEVLQSDIKLRSRHPAATRPCSVTARNPQAWNRFTSLALHTSHLDEVQGQVHCSPHCSYRTYRKRRTTIMETIGFIMWHVTSGIWHLASGI